MDTSASAGVRHNGKDDWIPNEDSEKVRLLPVRRTVSRPRRPEGGPGAQSGEADGKIRPGKTQRAPGG